MNDLFTVKISFVLVYKYISLSNIWVCLYAQQLFAAVIAQENCLYWKLEYTSFPVLCTRNTLHCALLPLGSRHNSKLPGKMILALERGKWRKPFLWCTPGRHRALPCPELSPAHPMHTRHHTAPQTQPRASAPALRRPFPISQWSPSSTDWLKCYNSMSKCEVSLLLITLLHLLLLSYMYEILFRTQ